MTLTDCPNAPAWTITSGYPPEPDQVVNHLTINRTDKSDDFVQSIIDFGNEWKAGIEQFDFGVRIAPFSQRSPLNPGTLIGTDPGRD